MRSPNPLVPPSLGEIVAASRRRVERLRPHLADLERRAAAAPPPPAFVPRLGGDEVRIIGEVKRRSPSAGAIRVDLDPVAHASGYVAGGAAAISVLTDELFFGGSLEDLARVARAVSVPVLRKDFIVDELQLLEARAAGASAVLLIVRVLGRERLAALARAARGCGLATLVEAHAERELDDALAVEPAAVGVNSRDLATYVVHMDAAARLVARVPRGTPVVAESGVERRDDVERFAAAGADAVLVGTAVARGADPAAAVRALVGVPRVQRAT